MLVCAQVDGVKLLDRFSNRKPITGTLYLTATHLIFVDPDGKRETWVITSVNATQLYALSHVVYFCLSVCMLCLPLSQK